MTNPNHTDTSRSGDLVELKAMLAKCNDSGHDWWLFALTAERDVPVLIDRIEALEMRVAELEDIAGDLLTRFEPWSPHDHDAAKRARAALKEIEGD